MKMKRFWKLYKELRLLRKKVKTLENDLFCVNQRYITLCSKRSQEISYSTMAIMIPNMYSVESCFNRYYSDERPRAEYIQKRMSESMKLKLVDDLFEQGFIRKVKDDINGEIYEIKCVNGRR